MGIAAILKAKGHEVASIAPTALVRDAVEDLHARRVGALLVCADQEVMGVVSERDVVRALATMGERALDCAVADVMTAPVITISPTDTVADAMALMTGCRIRHLPVMESGRLVGLVSIGDLVKQRIDEAEQEAMALKDYIAAG